MGWFGIWDFVRDEVVGSIGFFMELVFLWSGYGVWIWGYVRGFCIWRRMSGRYLVYSSLDLNFSFRFISKKISN